jgi:hypothetical protein
MESCFAAPNTNSPDELFYPSRSPIPTRLLVYMPLGLQQVIL